MIQSGAGAVRTATILTVTTTNAAITAAGIAALTAASNAAASVAVAATGPTSSVMPTVATTIPSSPAGSGLQVLFGLVVVMALLAGAAWMLRRFGPARGIGGANIKIVGGVSVGNRERVMVVEVADQWIVLGVAPGRVNALATLPRQEGTPMMTSPTTEPALNFSSWLKRTIDKRNGIQ